jgi:KEOPS complex subunit Cgi121
MMTKGKRTDELTQYHEYIKVAGFKAQITDFKRLMQDLRNFDSDCVIQLINADGIAGRKHAVHAAVHAIKSFSRKENISKDMGLEICVRASGQRQISQALKMLGIKNGKMNICAVALGCEENIMEKLIDVLGERKDSVLEADEDKLKKLYSISKMEAETAGSVSKVLMERTALLILES